MITVILKWLFDQIQSNMQLKQLMVNMISCHQQLIYLNNILLLNLQLTNSQMINSKKPKTTATKPQIVEFSDLNDVKKNQFLQFLLRNNITFQKGVGNNEDGYVAKLAVPKNKFNNKQNKAVKSTNKLDKSLIKSKQKSVKKLKKNNASICAVKPQFEKSITKMTTPKKQNQKSSQSAKRISSKLTPLQESKQNIKDIQQLNSSQNMKSARNENKKKPYEASKSIKTTQFLTSSNQISIMNKSLEREKKKNIDYQKVEMLNNNAKVKNNTAKQNYLLQKEKYILESSKSVSKSPNLSKKAIVSSKQKIVEVNTQVKKKTEEQKQICDLVNKYLKIFDLKLQGQRPIKWPIAQLLKTIEQVYTDLFAKNTQSISQRGHPFRQLLTYNQGFVKFIKQFFMVKHKSEKSSNSNIINMLYSLSCYLQNEKKIIVTQRNYVKEVKAGQSMTATGIYLQNFQDFVSQVYQFQDLLFYLFVRNVVLHQGEVMNAPKVKIEKQIKSHLFEKQIMLNYKEIVKILNVVLGQDEDLVEQYKIMILTHINSQNSGHKTEQHETKISVPDFMATLVQDYRTKRIMMQQSPCIGEQKKVRVNKSFVNHSLASDNTFEEAVTNSKRRQPEKNDDNFNLRMNLNQNETDQLTFGEQTQSNLQKYLQNQMSVDFCKQFWQSTQQTPILGSFPQNSVEQLLSQKLKQKVIQFINILIDNKSEYNSIQNKKIGQKVQQNEVKQLSSFVLMQRSYIIQLFMKKSLNLLATVIQMNKLKWFEELKVYDPNQDDIDRVEELQLNYRKLKSNPDAEAIGRLCKSLLTVPQITVALEKLICF